MPKPRHSAARQWRGLKVGLRNKLTPWRDQLLDLRAEIEAQLDFSDEGDVGDLPPTFADQVSALAEQIGMARDNVERGRVVREGMRVALAGHPNAGKSSLLNALVKSDIAIVTEEPGTTRDVREVPIDICGHLVVLLDLAGLRVTSSKAEAEGVRRALAALGQADLILWLAAPGEPQEIPDFGRIPVWILASKADLGEVTILHDLAISIQNKDALARLGQRLADFASQLSGGGEPVLVSRERDRAALTEAQDNLLAALTKFDSFEILAETLRLASQALERLIGRVDAEQVLDRLFSGFCIGK